MPFVPFAPTVGSFSTITTTGTINAGGTITASADISLVGHLNDTGVVPGVAMGTAAGTTPPAPVVPTGTNDDSGYITFGTGTTPTTGILLTITFNVAWVVPGGGAPHAVVSPDNAATQALGLYITNISPTAFSVACAVAPAASQGNTVYAVSYQVRG